MTTDQIQICTHKHLLATGKLEGVGTINIARYGNSINYKSCIAGYHSTRQQPGTALPLHLIALCGCYAASRLYHPSGCPSFYMSHWKIILLWFINTVTGIFNPKATRKIARAAFVHFQIGAGRLKFWLSPYYCSQVGATTNRAISKLGAASMDMVIFHYQQHLILFVRAVKLITGFLTSITCGLCVPDSIP